MSHRARVGKGEGIVRNLLIVLRVDGTHQSYLVRTLSKKRDDHVMATIPYSRAIEEKKYCVVEAMEVPDSLTHCLSDYLHFLA